ncbi:MAG TPA: DUF364 domain-containing protein [Methanocorpusculum sp.]|nr:DUF364 domain-containing protein [Methanocorpusculum sp.]
MSKSIVIEDLLATLPDKSIPVRSILIGAHWTAVCSAHCGLATTIIGNDCHGQTTVVRDSGSLHLKSAQELAEYAQSENPLEASIGIAAINSLMEVNEHNAVEINASEVLMEKGAGKNVALVGHFPFIPKLRKSVGNLWVIELNPIEDDYPAQSAAELIPQADIVAITASSLINHTMDNLLNLCDPDAQVIILGPSTPLSPVMFEHGANIIAGSRILDETAVLNCIGQGAIFQQVSGVKLLTFTNTGSSIL